MQRGNNQRTLSGEVISGSRITDKGMSLLESALPQGTLSNSSKVIVKSLNAAEFSRLFKGTFVARSTPRIRGFLNKTYNKITETINNTNFSEIIDRSFETSVDYITFDY